MGNIHNTSAVAIKKENVLLPSVTKFSNLVTHTLATDITLYATFRLDRGCFQVVKILDNAMLAASHICIPHTL